MDKNDTVVPTKKRDVNRLVIVISFMVCAALFMVDLYVMMNAPKLYIALVLITAVFFVAGFFFISAILHEINRNKKLADEQYENLFKSEKASYLLLKKAFEQIAELENKNTNTSSEEIIAAQKAIAKVTISRNKENADAVMNSNDKVLEKIFDIEEKVQYMQNARTEEQSDDAVESALRELVEKQQEFAASIKEMENSLNVKLQENLEAITEIQKKQIELETEIPNIISMSEKTLQQDEELPLDDLSLDSGLSFGEDLSFDEEISSVDSVPTFDAMDLGESVNLLDEEPAIENFDLGTSISFLDEEPLVESTEAEEVAEPEEIVEPEEIIEPEEITIPEEIAEPEEITIPEEIAEPEEITIPEEIAEPEEAPVVEKEETKEEAKVEMPDLSNPNKLMTPDEIAALIANM